MTPFLTDQDFTLYVGDVREVLAGLPDGSVDCVVTSPPYWGLRDYGTGSWQGGDPDCDHLGAPFRTKSKLNENWGAGFSDVKNTEDREPMGQMCSKCGATRQDKQLGLEPTPELFVENMVAVFREVRRVLAGHGTCWVNLGDSYSSDPKKGGSGTFNGRNGRGEDYARGKRIERGEGRWGGGNGHAPALKPKDLVGIPWSVAQALQAPYYTGRIAAERDRVWLAAILDGEGTICGMRHTRPNGNVRTGCMVFITNTSEALLNECDRIWQGSRYSEKVTSEVARPCWRWELQAAEDRSALVRELYPYLIEKKRQALVAWNLLEIVQSAKRLGRGGETTATKEKRDYLVRLLSDLNQRRPADLPSWLEEPPTLHEPGWYLRSDIIWAKKNPMPESVTDRPTKAHEYVFLLTKRPRYFFDQEAVREEASWDRWSSKQTTPKHDGQSPRYASFGREWTNEELERYRAGGRNVRSVWEIATQPYAEAHFATYPQELVRRCLLAGCPEQVCRTCGKPRERIVERVSGESEREPRGKALTSPRNDGSTWNENGGRGFMPVAASTLGWSDCGHNNYRPGTVLDPFIGSGTTAVVARTHNRRCVGIELNPAYAQLAAQRTRQLSLLA